MIKSSISCLITILLPFAIQHHFSFDELPKANLPTPPKSCKFKQLTVFQAQNRCQNSPGEKTAQPIEIKEFLQNGKKYTCWQQAFRGKIIRKYDKSRQVLK